MAEQKDLMEKIVSLAKRRGFIYQGSEIYGGLSGTWDYGPRGVALKNNIKDLWWKMFVDNRDDVYGLDAAILMNEKVWEASGHTGAGFTDPVVECKKCGHRYRADHLHTFVEDSEMMKKLISDGLKYDSDEIFDANKNYIYWICEECKTKNYGSEPRQFNLMFETKVGAEGTTKSYLRPETAQGIFVNFKNVVDSMNPKLPFGIAQIGKAFRNEIAPRDFVFRAREFEQMEVEYFVKEAEWERYFEAWRQATHQYIDVLGIDANKLHEIEIGESDRAHYSKRTIDFEFDFPFGRKELYGLAYRTDFDLSNHAKHSGEKLTYLDEETKEQFTPHVIEPSLGVDRIVLAVLVSAYREDEMGGEKRVYLALKPSIAPVKAAVFPLLKNKPELVAKAREVYVALKKEVPQVAWDDNGNIGKRYRRQDEIGTPFCITIDFDTLGEKPEHKDTVTLRHRDTGKQERMPIAEMIKKIIEVSKN